MSSAPDIVRLLRTGRLEPLDCHIHLSTESVVIASGLASSLDLDGLCLLPTSTVRTLHSFLVNSRTIVDRVSQLRRRQERDVVTC
jgi:hypothetical protein